MKPSARVLKIERCQRSRAATQSRCLNQARLANLPFDTLKALSLSKGKARLLFLSGV